MPVIHILPPHLADLIAAGEVVERPASVVKELVENAFDAGAHTVTVEVRGGGMTYLRVTDDGCGMTPEDAGVAFLRHATSKLHDARGLEAIGTMGFRGEALAAISAVSRIELTTRARGAASGVKVVLEAGEIQSMYETGCPEGTTMIVRDLFYNTPARLKFMKSDRAEGGACVAAAFRCALGRPEVSVRCLRDGDEQFFSPGDSRIDSCVYSLLGRDTAKTLRACSGEQDGVKVEGFISSPGSGHGNRARQYFYCNGRAIRSASLQAALEQAYRNTLLTGRFPACVLYITLSNAAVDVNVHPAKTEVKFTQEKTVFDAVYYACRSALEQERETAEVVLSKSTERAVSAPRGTAYDPTAAAPNDRVTLKSPTAPRAPEPTFVAPVLRPTQRPEPQPLPPRPAAQQTVFATEQKPAVRAERPEPARVQTALEQFPERAPAAEPEPPARFVGEIMNTYILVEKGERLLLIDKHAAHERINFDRLQAQNGPLMSQTLLAPIPFSPGAAAAEALRENTALIEQMGFALDALAGDSFLIRAVPTLLNDADAPSALEEIAEGLRRGARLEANALRDEVLKTVSCKAAIKAGWHTEPAELLKLADAVVSGRVKYCPHGRPVAVVLTRKELDKQFLRIV